MPVWSQSPLVEHCDVPVSNGSALVGYPAGQPKKVLRPSVDLVTSPDDSGSVPQPVDPIAAQTPIVKNVASFVIVALPFTALEFRIDTVRIRVICAPGGA